MATGARVFRGMGSAAWLISGLVSSLLLQGCFDDVTDTSSDADVLQDTPTSDIQLPPACQDVGSLFDLCPVGSEPSFSSELCDPGSTDEVQEVKGAAVGVCKEPSAACSLLCELAEPCLCGLQSLSADALICQPCDAVCGNDLCEFGEDPESCPFDCSGQCIPGSVRCFGDAIGTCDLRGFWSKQTCNNDGFCQQSAGQPPACTDCDESSPPVWLVDRDNDGYGDPEGATFTGCAPPSQFVIDGTDCDDTNPGLGGPTCDGTGCVEDQIYCRFNTRQRCDASGELTASPCDSCATDPTCRNPCVPRGQTRLCSSSQHTCVITPQSEVLCWGADSAALGPRATSSVAPHQPAPVEGLASDTPTQVTCGEGFSCVLFDTGQVQCWGANTKGQLGRGVTSDGEPSPAAVVGVEGAGTLADVAEVRAGFMHVCARTSQGQVFCWGDHGIGTRLLNTDEALTGNLSASPIEALYNERSSADGTLEGPAAPFCGAARLAMGKNHTCVLLHDARVACWGAGNQDAIGGAQVPELITPTYTASVSGLSCRDSGAPAEADCAFEVAGGALHMCALTEDENVLCWGDNAGGQIGGDAVSSREGNIIPLPSEVAALNGLALGRAHTCLLEEEEGGVRCWGENADGQSGPECGDGCNAPAGRIVDNATQIAASDNHTCALLTDSSVVCWGRDDAGELGQSAPQILSAPTTIIP